MRVGFKKIAATQRRPTIQVLGGTQLPALARPDQGP